jgi:steroid delta-isomerase-like uncharacterized protein
MADIKAILRRMTDEVMNSHNLDVIDEILADDFIEHDELPGLPQSREGVKQFFGMMIEAFPDFRAEATHMLVDGDTGIIRAVMSGTHKGEFMGIPATGKRFEVPTIDIVRFEGDRAAEHWGAMDMMSLMQQLGVVPPG